MLAKIYGARTCEIMRTLVVIFGTVVVVIIGTIVVLAFADLAVSRS
jgi:hypothetical protein